MDPAADPVRASLLLAQLAQARWHHGESERALPISEQAVAAMPVTSRSAEHAWVLAGHAKLLMLLDRLAESVLYADRAIEVGDEVGAQAAVGHAHATRGLALVGDWRCADSDASFAIAIANALRTKDPDDIGRSYINHAEALIRCGRPERAVEVLEQGLQAATEVGAVGTYGRFVRADLVATYVEIGRWDDAGRFIDDPSEHEVTVWQTRRYELARHVGLLVGRGDPSAGPLVEELGAMLEGAPVEAQFHALYWLARTEHDLWTGEPAAALTAVRAGLAQLETNEWRYAAVRLIRLGVRAAADLAALERSHEIGQEPGGDGGRAIDIDLARDPVGDPDLEVGGRELEAAFLGPEQDVGEDGECAPGRYRSAHHRQTPGQVLLHDREFHVAGSKDACRRSPGNRAGSMARPPGRRSRRPPARTTSCRIRTPSRASPPASPRATVRAGSAAPLR